MSRHLLREDSCLFGDNASLIEQVYSGCEKGDVEIPEGWRELFLRLQDRCVAPASSPAGQTQPVETSDALRVSSLLNFFRTYGHMSSNLDPLGLAGKAALKHEEYAAAALNQAGDNALWQASGRSISVLTEKLKDIYCGTIGFEFTHIRSEEERVWLQDKIESLSRVIEKDEQKEILWHLQETEMFEQFLHVKFPGYKRFSVEGGDALIPSLEKIISLAGQHGVSEIVLGMSHRGRLSVLTKVMRKPYAMMLHEFSGGKAYPDGLAVCGDVKYHLGYSCDRQTDGGKVHVTMAYNPSHLESVNPVVMGRSKAKHDMHGGSVLPVLVHGDASFIGQGVVAECFTIGGVAGYYSGGIVHIVVNNQIGFTTCPRSSRTSLYCSDVARIVDIPIFHVNGDCPESVVIVTKLAMDYRAKFGKDAVIDVVCYRRYGHNEGDEPMFTQPIMYSKISKHATVASQYADRLVGSGVVSKSEVEEFREKFRDGLNTAFSESTNYKPEKADWFDGVWKGLRCPDHGKSECCPDTGVAENKLMSLAEALCKVPQGFAADKKVLRMLSGRLAGVKSDTIDWGMGETLAFATLLAEKHRVRLSGEDSGRGTFSHRHARLIDQTTGDEYIPLNNLGVDQAAFEVLDSPLSEYAVMGFEYGYSLDSPHVLCIWEAQFGDFANGAQIVIDQFVVSAEAKWLRSSGLVLLLPHGYEGQGPEHSSGRMERYLQLCASDNIQVVNCTTPANYFHVLRRQLHRDFRKPLVVFTPKSLLRNKMAVSKLSDFSAGFLPVIPDIVVAGESAQQSVKKVVLCSGKVYYDLLEARGDRRDVALIRLEQLYPFPKDLLVKELSKYPKAEIIWCQEEHENMGGWDFARYRISDAMRCIGLTGDVGYAGREESASTAAGYASDHVAQQKCIMDSIFLS